MGPGVAWPSRALADRAKPGVKGREAAFVTRVPLVRASARPGARHPERHSRGALAHPQPASPALHANRRENGGATVPPQRWRKWRRRWTRWRHACRGSTRHRSTRGIKTAVARADTRTHDPGEWWPMRVTRNYRRVHGKGLEPLCLAAAEPKSAASASFATRALRSWRHRPAILPAVPRRRFSVMRSWGPRRAIQRLA